MKNVFLLTRRVPPGAEELRPAPAGRDVHCHGQHQQQLLHGVPGGHLCLSARHAGNFFNYHFYNKDYNKKMYSPDAGS